MIKYQVFTTKDQKSFFFFLCVKIPVFINFLVDHTIIVKNTEDVQR